MSTSPLHDAIRLADTHQVSGRVRSVSGLTVRATLPGTRLGTLVELGRNAASPLFGEVVGFQEDEATILPLGDLTGLGPDSPVDVVRRPLSLPCSDALLGRVLDGLGQPMDGKGPLRGEPWPLLREPPAALSRARVHRSLAVGVRAIDGLLTLGEGQRIGLFAGSGVGKSVLLGQVARQAQCDVLVLCLIGERGREVREFIEDSLGESLGRSVVVCATSDAPALVRLKSATTATAIAEWFRDQGRRVFLLMDSLSRFARAAREVGLASGELPVRRGYPVSLFGALPRLLERAGPGERGSITGFYTVLVEGGDLEEPVADEVRGILDGHIVLSRALADRGHYPAIDVLESLSRLMSAVATPAHVSAARMLREHLAVFEDKRDLVLLGAYKPGTDARLDAALSVMPAIEAFLRQDRAESTPFAEAVARLQGLFDRSQS